MSSTPVLERTVAESEVEWVEVVSPKRFSRGPKTADFVLAIAKLKSSIADGTAQSVTFDTDSIRELDANDLAVGQYAADVWDS